MAGYIPGRSTFKTIKEFFIPPKQITYDTKLIMEAIEKQQRWIENISETVQNIQEITMKYEQIKHLLDNTKNNQYENPMPTPPPIPDHLFHTYSLTDKLKSNIQDVLKAMNDV